MENSISEIKFKILAVQKILFLNKNSEGISRATKKVSEVNFVGVKIS